MFTCRTCRTDYPDYYQEADGLCADCRNEDALVQRAWHNKPTIREQAGRVKGKPTLSPYAIKTKD